MGAMVGISEGNGEGVGTAVAAETGIGVVITVSFSAGSVVAVTETGDGGATVGSGSFVRPEPVSIDGEPTVSANRLRLPVWAVTMADSGS